MNGQTETLPGDPSCVVTHRFARVNGIRLHYVEATPPPATVRGNERLCLLLHGFPEFWYSWRHQIPALAAAGFRVLAPDLRGYNLSDKPRGVPAYRLEALVADVAGLIRSTGAARAVVVGHDWGGVLAWYLPQYHPDLVEKLVVLNAPHPAAYRRELWTWRQLLKSWYVLFFQIPGLPEQVLSLGDYALLGRTLRLQPVHPQAFTPDDIRRYKQALARPGALTAALNYYRAALRRDGRLAAENVRPIQTPTLLLWGVQDAYLDPRLTIGLGPWAPNLRVERIGDAGHWLASDVPQRVNRLILDFVQES